MENGIFNRRNVISICVVAAVIVILTIVFLSRSNTGDSRQKDLPSGTISGLVAAEKVVKDLEGINICTLTSKDVVRHPLVQKIVKAYEDYEKKSSRPREYRRKKG